jgi:hypothetical protein
MELNPSWEVASSSAIQELNILWNPKVHYRVHKSSPLDPILSQIDPVYTTPSYLCLRSIFMLFTRLHLGLPSGLFPSDFPTNVLYAFPHSCYMPRLSHPLSLDHCNYTWRRVQVNGAPQYAVLSKLLSLHLSSVQIFFSVLCSQTPSVYAKNSLRKCVLALVDVHLCTFCVHRLSSVSV